MDITDSPETLERFNATLDLVEAIAARIARKAGPAFERDDLIAAGHEGLLEAARRFDPSHGIPFRSYAAFRVQGAIMDSVRRMGSLPRRARERLAALEAVMLAGEGEARHALTPAGPSDASSSERNLAEHLATIATGAAASMVAVTLRSAESASLVAGESSPEEAFARAELLQIVRRSVGELSADQAEIIRRHYLEGESLGDIAKDLAVSKQWASRLHVTALAQLTKRLRSRI